DRAEHRRPGEGDGQNVHGWGERGDHYEDPARLEVDFPCIGIGASQLCQTRQRADNRRTRKNQERCQSTFRLTWASHFRTSTGSSSGREPERQSPAKRYRRWARCFQVPPQLTWALGWGTTEGKKMNISAEGIALCIFIASSNYQLS